MGIGLFARNNVTPASFSYDLAADPQIDHAGPYKVSLVGWTLTADAAAGVLVMTMTHRTPNGVDRGSPIVGGNIILADATSYFSSPIEMISRLSDVSLWTLDAVLAGLAGASKVGYAFIVEPMENTDYSAIGAGVSP